MVKFWMGFKEKNMTKKNNNIDTEMFEIIFNKAKAMNIDALNYIKILIDRDDFNHIIFLIQKKNKFMELLSDSSTKQIDINDKIINPIVISGLYEPTDLTDVDFFIKKSLDNINVNRTLVTKMDGSKLIELYLNGFEEIESLKLALFNSVSLEKALKSFISMKNLNYNENAKIPKPFSPYFEKEAVLKRLKFLCDTREMNIPLGMLLMSSDNINNFDTVTLNEIKKNDLNAAIALKQLNAIAYQLLSHNEIMIQDMNDFIANSRNWSIGTAGETSFQFILKQSLYIDFDKTIERRMKHTTKSTAKFKKNIIGTFKSVQQIIKILGIEHIKNNKEQISEIKKIFVHAIILQSKLNEKDAEFTVNQVFSKQNL